MTRQFISIYLPKQEYIVLCEEYGLEYGLEYGVVTGLNHSIDRFGTFDCRVTRVTRTAFFVTPFNPDAADWLESTQFQSLIGEKDKQ